MFNFRKKVSNISNNIVSGWDQLNAIEGEMAILNPSLSSGTKMFSLDEYKKQNGDLDLMSIMKKLDIDYVDDAWTKSDWAITFIAALIGAITDVLITESNVFKGVDKKVKDFLDSPNVNDTKKMLDNFSNSFRNGASAPIDYQDFQMSGMKSIHEVYSYGHDPLRFISGISQFISGDFHGIDKFGNSINASFGEPIPNVFHATISYVAHMLSDFLNKQGIPYPGSTFLMQFGSDQTRQEITIAYRGELFNARTAIYQSLPILLMNIVIHSYAIYSNYTYTGKINLAAGRMDKYQSMLLVANATVSLENISVATVRGCLGDAHAMFRVNWPVITNTVRLTIKNIASENKKIADNQRRIDEMMKEASKPIEKKSVDQYMADLDKEYEEFCKRNGGLV